MNMTNLEPRCCSNIYYNNYHTSRDLLESVGLTIKNNIYYCTIGSVEVPRQFLSDELWEAISWIQLKFYAVTIYTLGGIYRRKDSNIVVTNYRNSISVHGFETMDKPPKEAFDLVESFIFINKYHEIPETIKRMMDEEEVEMMLEG